MGKKQNSDHKFTPGSADLENLADQYLDLWQRQLSTTLVNPDEFMNVQKSWMDWTQRNTLKAFGQTENDQTGTTPSSASHDDSNDRLSRALERIASLEERLEFLESELKKRSD